MALDGGPPPRPISLITSKHATPTFSFTARPFSSALATPTATTAVFDRCAPPHPYDEQKDIERELRADGDNPFPIRRKLLRDVVQDKLAVRIESVQFLSSGTFHKAFLLYLDTTTTGYFSSPQNTPSDQTPTPTARPIPPVVVFRIARPTMHMPKLKTESEVATLAYLRAHTHIPVPTVYAYDANPQNVLAGEWIVMSKAPGVPLSRFFHTLPPDSPLLQQLLANLARLLLPLFAHRFSAIGSLYFKDTGQKYPSLPGTVPLRAPLSTSPKENIIPGPIIAYPFFGSSRGLLSHVALPPEIDRGPWTTFAAYLEACVSREVEGVRREGMGMSVGRRPRVAPRSEEGSGSESEEESDEEDEHDDGWGVDWRYAAAGGAAKARAASFDTVASTSTEDSDKYYERDYRDYRATQRSTFLVAHTARREEMAKEEMAVFEEVMVALREEAEGGLGLGEEGLRRRREKQAGLEDLAGEEAFTLDCHDLSLENVFVDETDPAVITCIIDWESTCTRPLFQAAHLPAFLQPHHGYHHRHGRHHYSTHHTPHHATLRSHGGSHHHHHHHHHHHYHHPPNHTPLYLPSTSPAANLFRRAILAAGQELDLQDHAARWLRLERDGAKRRWAHRCVEWDGWEEGLVGQILGELEYGWQQQQQQKERCKACERDVNFEEGGRELERRLAMWVRQSEEAEDGKAPEWRPEEEEEEDAAECSGSESLSWEGGTLSDVREESSEQSL